jgi:transposase
MTTFTHNFMKLAFNLQDVVIYGYKKTKNSFLVRINQPRKPSACPHCFSKSFHSHGKGRKRKIKHGLLQGRQIVLVWQSQRYRCGECGKTWSKSPPKSITEGKSRFSFNCKKKFMDQLRVSSFNQTSKDLNSSYSTISKVLKEVIDTSKLINHLPKKGELSIGIDEHSRAKRKLALTITLIRPEKKLLTVLAKATTEEFNKFCQTAMTKEERERVTEIACDMKVSLKNQMVKQFPNARFVIDKFHVIAYLNQYIAKEFKFQREIMDGRKKRKVPPVSGLVQALRESPRSWDRYKRKKVTTTFKLIPELEQFYWLKESFRRAYWESKTKEQARKQFNKIIIELPNQPRETLQSNLEEILNYYDNQTTNAFTEGVHNKMKLIKRLSFGFKNEEIYVKKILLGFMEPESIIFPHTS